ncbi:MAG: hypothetical protein JXA42_05260 [Anaerolineales bacterium]|nr:hypothetical protein [Anaerolineales bacterium]
MKKCISQRFASGFSLPVEQSRQIFLFPILRACSRQTVAPQFEQRKESGVKKLHVWAGF